MAAHPPWRFSAFVRALPTHGIRAAEQASSRERPDRRGGSVLAAQAAYGLRLTVRTFA
jgi:hypothetical protein